MKTATAIAQTVVRAPGLILIVLGVLFWTGHALTLIAVHMLLGILLVLSLWTLAVIGARAGAKPGLFVLTILWGFVVPALGMAQGRLLPGGAHWVIQVLHLLVGLSSMALAERLARGMQGSAVPARPTQRAAGAD